MTDVPDLSRFVEKAKALAQARAKDDAFNQTQASLASKFEAVYAQALFAPYHEVAVRNQMGLPEYLTLTAVLGVPRLTSRFRELIFHVIWNVRTQAFNMEVKEIRFSTGDSILVGNTFEGNPLNQLERLADNLATRMGQILESPPGDSNFSS